VIKPPPNQIAVQQQDAFGRWSITDHWKEYFSDVFGSIFAMQKSGTTAQRPTKGLYIGLVYFDTTLGNPIWYSGTDWVDATGAPA
jgi:hypothetical protein